MSIAVDQVRTIGFIGSGRIGTAVARRALAAGYEVVLSNSRGPETLTGLVSELTSEHGEGARAGTTTDAAAADVVVVTIPLHAYAEVPADALEGRVVLDTLNYYPDRDGRVEALDEERATTSGLLQGHLADAHVVKAFNTIHSDAIGALARPTGSDDRSALPIFGEDFAAKDVATAVLDRLGFDVVDGGGLAESWRAENGRPAYALPYATDGDIEDPSPAGRDEIADLLAAAGERKAEPFTFVAPE
ncbi:NADPH-dependent F420 reductase [Nocardioides sp. CFH 31398]|uniref:NADPH-dependent F420 reductase n=1 Tax=Nocardioides sp. CFH 31398 TaxID=2919579 RepID=UPI001F053B62|nr:NAD(P)-binding domain-containing protein [Nocardioides sp. CFH 31398]MCH1865775.1 NAD(P)-binding domain-containing protein [Nocardioides sp. CFH 31398]